jgi:hypothetical protein
LWNKGGHIVDATADNKLKLLEKEIKRLQKEIVKLKTIKREEGRARKQLTKSLRREIELQAVIEDTTYTTAIAAEEIEKKEKCKQCSSERISSISAGNRTIIVCQACETRYTIIHEIAESA